MSILAQQLGLSTSFVGNETNNKKEMMYVNSELVERRNAFSGNDNKYPDDREYVWSNSSVTLDDDGRETINQSVLDTDIIG